MRAPRLRSTIDTCPYCHGPRTINTRGTETIVAHSCEGSRAAYRAAHPEEFAPVRYQILFADETPIENFTLTQRAAFLARCEALKAHGIKFTVWDTVRVDGGAR